MSSTLAILCASVALAGQPVRCGTCRGGVCAAPVVITAPTTAQPVVKTVPAPAKAAAPVAATPAPAAPAAPKSSVAATAPAPSASAATSPAVKTPAEATTQNSQPSSATTEAPKATTPPANAPAENKTAVAKPVDEMQLQAVEQGVLERTNAERARYGLRPLIIDRLLLGQARRHAAWMPAIARCSTPASPWPRISPWDSVRRPRSCRAG
jgi:hypothetical protein